MSKKNLSNFAKKNHLAKGAARVSQAALNGDVAGIKQMINQAVQSKVSKTLASGQGAYGRGAYAYGRGSYDVAPQAPINVNSLFKEHGGRRPHTSQYNDETGRVTVSRREYVMRVVSPATPGDFSNTSFSINPGLSGVFAWGSQVAANYDEYTLSHLVFHYKPVISQASQSGAMGTVVLSCNYNAGSQKFETFREMVEYVGSMETRICDPALFGIECDPKKHSSQEVEYVRTGSVPVGEDIKTYDLGLFQIATSDISASDYPAGTLLGHLYVEYEMTLGKPKLYSALGKGILEDMWRGTAGCAVGAPFGTAPIANLANTMGVALSGDTITFPDNFYGRVSVTYYISGTGISLGVSSVTGNVTKQAILGRDGTSSDLWSETATTRCFFVGEYQIATASALDGNTITLVCDAGTGFDGFSLTVAQCNPDFDSWP